VITAAMDRMAAHFATPNTLATAYALALVAKARTALTALNGELARPDADERLPVYLSTRAYPAFQPPTWDGQRDVALWYDNVVASVKVEAGEPSVLVGDSPANVALRPQRFSGEATGPVPGTGANPSGTQA